jgi:hypothetical protein
MLKMFCFFVNMYIQFPPYERTYLDSSNYSYDIFKLLLPVVYMCAIKRRYQIKNARCASGITVIKCKFDEICYETLLQWRQCFTNKIVKRKSRYETNRTNLNMRMNSGSGAPEGLSVPALFSNICPGATRVSLWHRHSVTSL